MSGMTYRDAGVDIDKKSRALAGIGALVKSTFGPGVLHELGAFGGMYSGRFEGHDDPIIVATNDGVGTKVRTALKAGRPRGLGHDIVNHCVDDILVQGAEPLFFFDYVASSVLEPEVFTELVAGMADACKACGAALLGGETAEMPGVYADGELDLVGFIVGVVDRSRVWPRNVAAGDALIGVRSDGLHTNGFSLVNRLIERDDLDLHTDPGGLGESLADALLRPHRSYLDPMRTLRDAVDVHALAHITGGGLQDNLPRVLPDGVGAEIDRTIWTPNPVFQFLTGRTEMPAPEAYHVFNMGCGLVIALPDADVDRALDVLAEAGEEAWRIGALVDGQGVTFTDDL